jgi:hypothetical protein
MCGQPKVVNHERISAAFKLTRNNSNDQAHTHSPTPTHQKVTSPPKVIRMGRLAIADACVVSVCNRRNEHVTYKQTNKQTNKQNKFTAPSTNQTAKLDSTEAGQLDRTGDITLHKLPRYHVLMQSTGTGLVTKNHGQATIMHT